MAYVPADDSALVAPVKGSSAVWPLLISNDEACFEEYSPGFETNPTSFAYATAREFRWRVYGNMDNASLAVAVRGRGVSGPHTVTIATPGVDSDTVAVGADAWYGVSLQANGPMQEVVVSSAALGGGSLTINGLRCHQEYSTVVAGTPYPSGYRLISSQWGTSGFPVPSEIQERLARNPRQLARDRPVCVAAHVVDALFPTTFKSDALWSAYNTQAWTPVGRLHIPRCDRSERVFRVDAYVDIYGDGTEEYAVKIGPREERWTGLGWHSWQVRLGPTEHELRATVKPGLLKAASIRTLTVWRTEL